MGKRSDEVKKIFIDANIFLEMFLKQKRKDECVELFEKIKEGKIHGFTSNFIIFGISLILEKYNKSPKEIRTIIEDLFGMKNFTIYDLTPSDLIDSTKKMEKYDLGLEDSFCLQGAVIGGLKSIVSFDKDFDKVKEIKRIEPKDVV